MESTISEATIRDSLARNLGLLEPGLNLIEIEYRLKNPIGSKGFIDILAKDRFGNRVVIEVKRTDPASRQAIHEIFKYFELYQNQNHIPDHKLRCFVVSTTWRELRVPFDSLVRNSQLQVDGFSIEVNGDGEVAAAKRVEPLELSESFRPFPTHDIYLFRTAEKRDIAMPKIEAAFTNCGGETGLLITWDYEGCSDAVIYPFSVYVVPAALTDQALDDMKKACLEEDSDFDATTPDGRATLRSELSIRMQKATRGQYDTFECGSHEKFSAEGEAGWKTKKIRRIGNVPDATAATDEELLSVIAGYSGDNAVVYFRLATPRIAKDWGRIPGESKTCLIGNENWTRSLDWAAQWIAKEMPGASVSIAIYNPQDFLQQLYPLLVRGDPGYLPRFEIVASDEKQGKFRIMTGEMLWDGVTRPESVRNVFTPGIGGVEQALMYSMMKESWHIDAKIMKRQGLYYGTFFGEVHGERFSAQEIEVLKKNGGLIHRPVARPGKHLPEFFEDIRPYLQELAQEISRHTVNW